MRLLTSNAKLALNPSGRPWIVAGLALAPAKTSGRNVCTDSTAGCRKACTLWNAGRTVMSTYRKAAIRRTLYLLADREGARRDILADLESVARRAAREGARAFLRLNVASDLDMRRLLPGVLERAAELGIEAYDYSKAHARVLAQLQAPSVPWALSYSVNERTTYAMARAVHDAGGNLVVPFVVRYYAQGKRYGTLPARVVYRCASTGEAFSTPGIDGDRYDPRVPDLDGRGVTVGLRAKGTRAALAEGIAEGFLRPGAHDAVTLGDKATAGEAIVVLP